MSDVRVGILCSRIRSDERLLIEALDERGHEVVRADIRKLRFDLDGTPLTPEGTPHDIADVDVVVDRCLSATRGLYAARHLQSAGVPVVNDPDVAEICADKAKTSLALADAGVPTPRTEVAFTQESALAAIESFGYPCVLKPVTGSWGRLMAKIDSPNAAEAILEHKKTLGHYEHGVFYVQEFVDKPGRDLRVVAVDGEPIAGMARYGDDWLTNAARGAETEPFAVNGEVEELVRAASETVGGGLLGVDLMETGSGYTVHEVNHGVEFTALNGTVETDVPGAVVEWLETVATDADTIRAEVTV